MMGSIKTHISVPTYITHPFNGSNILPKRKFNYIKKILGSLPNRKAIEGFFQSEVVSKPDYSISSYCDFSVHRQKKQTHKAESIQS